MASAKKHAFILGATGAVGQQLLRQLCENDKFAKVHAPTRKEITFHHKKIVRYDFADFYRPWKVDIAVTDFFYCFGTTLKSAGSKERFREIELNAAHQALVVAKQTQTRRFYLVSSRDVDPNSMVLYLRVKSEVEKVIKDHLFQSLFIYRPSLILAPRSELRPMELMAQKTLGPMHKLLQRYFPSSAPVQAEQIAKAMLSDALSSEEGVFIRENKQIIELAQLIKETKTLPHKS